jgi:hypothetical protein
MVSRMQQVHVKYPAYGRQARKKLASTLSQVLRLFPRLAEQKKTDGRFSLRITLHGPGADLLGNPHIKKTYLGL